MTPISKYCFGTILFLACSTQSTETPTKTPTTKKIPVIGSVRWTEQTDFENVILEAEFEKAAKKAFEKLEPVNFETKPAVLQGRLTGNKHHIELFLQIKIPTENKDLAIETSIVALLSGDKPIQQVLEQALHDLATAVRELLRVAEGTEKVWIESLFAAEADVQILAVRLLEKKQSKAAVAPLIELLKDPKQEVAEASASALKKIADSSHVQRILKSIPKNNIRGEVRILEIIASAGGPEAEAYLEMTAGGHEIGEVRILSASLLKKLRDRRNKQKYSK